MAIQIKKIPKITQATNKIKENPTVKRIISLLFLYVLTFFKFLKLFYPSPFFPVSKQGLWYISTYFYYKKVLFFNSCRIQTGSDSRIGLSSVRYIIGPASFHHGGSVIMNDSFIAIDSILHNIAGLFLHLQVTYITEN